MQLRLDQVTTDIDATNGQFRIAPGCHETPEAWTSRFRCLPSAFLSQLSHDLVATCRVEFCLRLNETGRCRIQLFHDGGNICTAEREFDLSALLVTHVGMSVVSNRQNQGIGKTLLRNSMRLYRRLGIRRILTDASLDAGGYTWAKFGFRPFDTAWKAIKPEVARRFGGLKDRVSEESRRVVREAIRDPDGAAIWQISDLIETVGDYSLGRHLLARTDWKGYLDLMDQDMMDRFRAYVGEHSYKAP